MNIQKDYSVLKIIAVAVIVILIIVAFIPVLRGWGQSVAYGSSQNVIANAELQRAIGESSQGQAQLAAAEAERYRGMSEALKNAPDVIASASGLSVNIGLALLMVFGGLGLAYLIGSVGYSVVAYANVYREVKHAQAQIWLFDAGVTDPDVLPAVRTRAAFDDPHADRIDLITAKSRDQSSAQTNRTSAGGSRARPGKFGVGNTKPRPPGESAGHHDLEGSDAGILTDADIEAYFD